jgi:hypothetical protein
MNIVRGVFVLVMAVGVVVTLGKVSLGHEESHGAAKSHHEGHHGEHHDGHHGEHHDAHHHDHHDGHHDGHHDHHDGFDRGDWYRHEWWNNQASWHHLPWHHWWHQPTTSEIGTWSAGWGLTTPTYYDYGPNGNVVYRNRNVYIDGGFAGTADAYTKSAIALANTSPVTNGADDQADAWLPLGTFAVLPNRGDTTSKQTLQLAINKTGSVSGALFDLPKATATPVQGSLDRATQRVAFDLGVKSGLVAEAGVYNLTKDKASLLVHKENEKPEVYTLVRLKTPPTDAKEEGHRPNAETKL